MNIKENLKNYGLWLSLFALLGLFLSDMSWLPDNYELYVQLILAVLVALGIVASPSIKLNKGNDNKNLPDSNVTESVKKDNKGPMMANQDSILNDKLYIEQTQKLIHEISEANKRKQKELEELEKQNAEEASNKEECIHDKDDNK